MSLLRILGRIFGGGGASKPPGDGGIYYYVKCNRCGEVIQVRVNPSAEISLNDEENGYFARKFITGRRCYNKIEAVFNYTGQNQRTFAGADIAGGDLVDRAAYDADQAAHPSADSA